MNNIFVNNLGDLADTQRISYYKFLINELNSIIEPLLKDEKSLKTKTIVKKKKKNKNKLKYLDYKIFLSTTNIKLRFPEEDLKTFIENNLTYSVEAYLPIFYSIKEQTNTNFSLPFKNDITEQNLNNLEIINEIENDLNFKDLEKLSTISKKNYKKNDNFKITYCAGDIFLSEIPLITEHGTFLIAGCERIVVNQITRSPGIYFRKEINPITTEKICTATIISDNGLWTKFNLISLKKKFNLSIDVTDLIGKTIFEKKEEELKKHYREWELDTNEEEILEKQEISIFSFLKYFGISFLELSSCLTDTENILLKKFIKKTNFEKLNSNEEIEEIIDSRFFDTRVGCFSIGKIGRNNINKKILQDIPESVTYLTGLDFIFILKNIIALKFFGTAEDDIDHLKNKQIRPVGEILQNLFRVGYFTALADLEFFEAEEKIIDYKKKKNAFKLQNFENILYSNTQAIWANFLDFFKLSQISQYMDETNALAEIAHKRRISVFGPNGLERDNISDMIRDIHPSQYARLCPVETPEGESAGLVSSLAIFSRFNQNGNIEAPFFETNNAKIIKEQPAEYLDPGIESGLDIAFGDFCINNSNSLITQDNILIKKDIFLSSLQKRNIFFTSLAPNQLLSISTNLVPFIEHNDANRGLMGANMQRQATPLLFCQKAIIGTGFESSVIQDSGFILSSYTEGIVYKVNNKNIIIEDLSSQRLIYELQKYSRSNQDTCINQQSCVWPGELIFSGQIIADANGTLDGEYAIGKNLLIAYMPWDGYNFEDAIVINERLVHENVLTSIQIEEYQTHLEENFFKNSRVTPLEKKEALFEYIQRNANFTKLSYDLIIQVITYILSDNVLEASIKLDDKKVKSKIREIFFSIIENLSPIELKLKKDILSFFNEFIKEKKIFFNKKKLKKKLEKTKPKKQTLKELSKLPLEEDLYGESEDIIPNYTYLTHFHLTNFEARNLNSESIIKKGSYVYPGEILVGKVTVRSLKSNTQLQKLKLVNKCNENENYEDFSFKVPSYLEGRVLDLNIFEENNNSENIINNIQDFQIPLKKIKIFIAQIKKIEIGDKLAGRHGNKGVISKIVPQQDMPFLEDGMPIDIIFNPLGVPSRMNVGQVFETLLGFAGFNLGKRFKVMPFDEIFGKEASRCLVLQKLKEARITTKKNWLFSLAYPGKILLKDGRTGEFFDNPILVGKSYIVKLSHLVSNKEHARGVGPYSSITQQPLAGKASEGGQRFGEMESWALQGFGSAFILHELFSLKSDDINSRNEFYRSIAMDDLKQKPNPGIGETFLMLIRELNALGLDFNPEKIELFVEKKPKLYLNRDNFFEKIEARLDLKALIEKIKIKKLILQKKYKLEKNKKKKKLKYNYSTLFLKNFLNFKI